MKGYWKVFFKNGEIIDNAKCYFLDKDSDYVVGYLKDKKDVLFAINKDQFSHAMWIDK